ncbi:MAG TPA: GreA/GreB family elongation factor [Patescibacteria group bacterium]|nr:GreA/GreB family elongation factor [Patescibacteria group bacterium]
MRVPIRKPGKYTHEKADPNITEDKFNELQKKVQHLKKNVRPRLASEVKRLALMGDFSENAAYSIAKGKLRGLNQKIIDIEDLLKRAEIIVSRGKNKVQLGSIVTFELDGKIKTYKILGSVEANPDLGIISANSPLGEALLARKKGENFTFRTKDSQKQGKVLKIE